MAQQLTVASPTNIAVIKYWGKRDGKYNLPINSSVSITINQADLRTVTSVTVSKDFPKDRLWLNGEEEDIEVNKRVQKVFAMVRERSSKWEDMKVHVVSVNNFPTAAGLASSAAGYAALAFALAKLYGLEDEFEGDLSRIARVGSGSACRSLAGGFVAWDMGSKDDGADSCSRQVAPADHWPDLQVLILVVSDKKKAVSSTAGMQTAVDTSPLLAHRAVRASPSDFGSHQSPMPRTPGPRSSPRLSCFLIAYARLDLRAPPHRQAHVVPARMVEMETAYKNKDFAAFAKLAMQAPRMHLP